MAPRVAIGCTSITPTCLVEYTIYGYYPNLGLNAFFAGIFGLLALAQIGLGAFYRTYFFASVMAFGCIAEVVGYGGRIIMNDNPYSKLGFNMQISCLIFAPSFIAAGIYIIFKHVVQTFGPAKSRIPASYYLSIFVVCDLIALLLQATGGGLAGSAGEDQKQRDNGTDVMMAGIVFQVITMTIFISLVTDYTIRTTRSWDQVPISAEPLRSKTLFRLFVIGITLAFVTVYARCVYRIAEMAGGWANPIMRNQTEFVVMEGVMIVVAGIAMTVLHPGYCFPQLGGKMPAYGEALGNELFMEDTNNTKGSSKSSRRNTGV
ncbi:RTA1 like protein-domain-containing protein [Amylocarpus encephaloides]|uniref:RTA1 like protein-domain-containing protein n=1 Tax=Amylocarpus encephaloides TaxID=45428 RepID=A0A9P8C3Q0_9HELO|nr:RTA1 like protein-domain-containing protein [Amylocarpus encephaloides]